MPADAHTRLDDRLASLSRHFAERVRPRKEFGRFPGELEQGTGTPSMESARPILKARDMATNALNNGASHRSWTPPSGPEHRTAASYERELARLRSADVKLRGALARAECRLRQSSEAMQKHMAFDELVAWQQEVTICADTLTPRQRQIMELILAGCPNKNIAVDLGISQRTVESHRAAIMKRTKSRSLPALVRFGFVLAWNTGAPFAVHGSGIGAVHEVPAGTR